VTKQYITALSELYSRYSDTFEYIIRIISEIDVAYSSAKCAQKYAYNKPIIEDKYNEQSFIDIHEMRHPIIERIIDNEFVANDIHFNPNELGVLLYSFNGVGKSTLLRSIGCNIILAQAGMFVASTNMTYYPYHKLLSKISCNDNLFKGESTFVKEMNELRNFLIRGDNRSIILADELCAGTESISATSIVASTIMKLLENKTQFMFSSHLHSLMEINDIKENDKLRIKHLLVNIESNEESGASSITYHRTLQDGSGDSLYGLEIAKFCGVNNQFLKRAYQYRSILEKRENEILSTKKSKYNSKLYVHECSYCGKHKQEAGALETHHISFQCTANEIGIIDNKFHKNMLHNLIVLCRECHQKVHSNK
jgi:DNA mismatch repair protein MutS